MGYVVDPGAGPDPPVSLLADFSVHDFGDARTRETGSRGADHDVVGDCGGVLVCH